MKNKIKYTLIELLVVVAIIGILAAVKVVAYNGYTNSAKSSNIKSTCKSIEKFIRLETMKCNTGMTDYIFDQSNRSNFLCPLSVQNPGRIAKNAFINYVGYSRCCSMKNPRKERYCFLKTGEQLSNQNFKNGFIRKIIGCI